MYDKKLADKLYREKNREWIIEKRKKYKTRLKLKVLKLYNSKCNCCGITVFWNLTLDHINPLNGKFRMDNMTQYLTIINKPKIRNEYQILCFGCNNSKHIDKYCSIKHNM